MARPKLVMISVFLIGLVMALARAQGAEKVIFGTPARGNLFHELIALAAEEKGFWKKNGLDVEWAPFRGGAEMHRAVAARAVNIGTSGALSVIQAISRGVPELIVADIGKEDYLVWVRPDSPLKDVRELKGKLVGINRFGGVAHAYAFALARVLGLEGSIRFMAGGGSREEVGAMKTGTLDARVGELSSMMLLKLRGELRPLANIRDYFSKEWPGGRVILTNRELAARQPELVRRGVRAVLETIYFVTDQPAWSVEKIKAETGLSEEKAKEFYQSLGYSRQGKVSPQGVEAARNFLIEYGLIPKEKAPATEMLYSTRFID